MNKLNDQFQVFTFGRCGTVFLELLLKKEREWIDRHYVLSTPHINRIFVEDLKHRDVDIFFTYRSDWWGWMTSQFVANRHGYFHAKDFDSYKDRLYRCAMTENDIKDIMNVGTTIATYWEWVAQELSGKNLFVIEFSDLINKFEQYSSHQKVPYTKQDWISNYSEAHELFHERYLPSCLDNQERMLSALTDAGCEFNITESIIKIHE